MKTFAPTFMIASSIALVSSISLAANPKLPAGPSQQVNKNVSQRPNVQHNSPVSHPMYRDSHRPIKVVRPILIERSLPQVIAQPVCYPADLQASAGQNPTTDEAAQPVPVMDTPGDAAVKEQQAEILAQQARTLTNENNLKQTEGMLAQKKMWSDDQSQSRLDHEARLAHGQQLLAERRRTVYRSTYQLSASELNLATGTITWPTALQSESFAAQRSQMSELLRQLATYSDSRPATMAQISKATETWSRELKSQAGSVDRQDYLAAQKFLLGIKYTAESLAEAT